MTDKSPGAHNAWMNVYDMGYDLSSYVRTVRESAAQNNAELPLIVLFGDHGSHYGDAVERSAMGRIEHKFPALVMLLPKTWLAADPALKRNLDANRQRLISAFDLHHTLAEFATSYPGSSRSSGQASEPGPGKGGSSSGGHEDTEEESMISRRNFFSTEIPVDRACSDAGIQQIWCQCINWVPCTSSDRHGVRRQAEAALAVINGRVAELQEKTTVAAGCASLTLSSSGVKEARTSASPSSIEIVMAVHTGGRAVTFKVAMTCGGQTLPPLSPAPPGRCLPEQPAVCNVSTVFRLSSMSAVEDVVYKALGASFSGGAQDGKLCVID